MVYSSKYTTGKKLNTVVGYNYYSGIYIYISKICQLTNVTEGNLGTVRVWPTAYV